MDALEIVELLAERARRERVAPAEVRVEPLLRDARGYRREPLSLFPLAWSAAASALAASLVLGVALRSGSTSTKTDSVTATFSAAQMEMP